MTLSYDIITA